jgi:XapX domain-containing protein
MLRPYLVSLGVGVVVGLFYAVVGVRSPAPPCIALLGLLGFLIGENGYPMLRDKLRATGPPQITSQSDQTHKLKN